MGTKLATSAQRDAAYKYAKELGLPTNTKTALLSRFGISTEHTLETFLDQCTVARASELLTAMRAAV